MKNVVNPADWMSRVADEKRITEINIPGTHDSLARFVAFTAITRTQSVSVTEQLEMGVRYFDFRFIKTKNGLVAAHGGIRCKAHGGIFAPPIAATAVAKDCVKFLEKHPGETILFQLKEDKGGAGETLYTEFYNTVIKENEDSWFIENRISALGEVRGKIVMLRAVDANGKEFTDKHSGINFSAYPYIGSKKIGDYRFEPITDFCKNKYAGMYVQDSYRLQMNKKWAAVKQFLESDLDSRNFNINLLSCAGILMPFLNSKYINKRFMDYRLDKSKVYGIIAVDYAAPDVCRKIFETNY